MKNDINVIVLNYLAPVTDAATAAVLVWWWDDYAETLSWRGAWQQLPFGTVM